MRTIPVFLALLALFLAELALASANVTTAIGTTQLQSGTGPVRPLRVGDRVNQGDTVITGPTSSIVLKFDDGQVAALTSNSRMAISAYEYNPATQGGSVLLSLATGAMRTITGLIGRTTPSRVTVRAGAATVGIRGTDFTVVTDSGKVFVQVNGGSINFTFNNQTITIDTGRAAITNPNGTVTPGTINQLTQQLSSTPEGRAILDALGGIEGLTGEIDKVFPGIQPLPPRPPGLPGTVPGSGTGGGGSKS
jgi:hypothetical protein